jgi:hypothetical protein
MSNTKGGGNNVVPSIEIDIYVVNLVMDIVIKKMRECDTFEKLKNHYWYAKLESGNRGNSQKLQFIPDPKFFMMQKNGEVETGSNKLYLVNQVCNQM